ncbi:hypothetical protein M3Y97_00928200 [Aphelenchoides bicaudatus]|nr:hypothetical protein M3Y97_00928200 [Aphelenchoides bicaudatus]
MEDEEEPTTMEIEAFNQHVRERIEKIGKLSVKRKCFSFTNSLTTTPALKKRRITFMSPDSFQFEPNQAASSTQMPHYQNDGCSFLSDRFFLCADIQHSKLDSFILYDLFHENKLELDEDSVDFELNFVCLHFIGNKFYGLKLKEEIVKLYEFQLDFESRKVNLNKTTDVNGVKFDIFDLLFFDFSVHAASDTSLYLCSNKTKLIKPVYHFNLQTGAMNEIARLCFTKSISTIHVNEDEILSICTKDDDSKYKVLRIPTRRPEKLETIALLETKQKLMFDNSTRLHGKLVEMMPYQMKPFYLKVLF